MGAEAVSGEPTILENLQLLNEPAKQLISAGVRHVMAIAAEQAWEPGESDEAKPVAYVDVVKSKINWHGEFSGKPTGTFSHCTSVVGVVGEEQLYRKNVPHDEMFTNLRVAVAKRRAARRVSRMIK